MMVLRWKLPPSFEESGRPRCDGQRKGIPAAHSHGPVTEENPNGES
jgi:hypothetical protein